MPAVPSGWPARPAGRQQGRPPLPLATAGPRRRSSPGTPRPLLPAFPSGGTGLPASTCHTAGPSPAPRGCSHGRMVAREPDLTRAGGASVVADARTGRPGNANRSWTAPAASGADPGTGDDPLLTIEEVTAELRVSRRSRQQMDSYDVRFWDTKKIADNASGGRYRVGGASTARSTASRCRADRHACRRSAPT
jgi:hypothetical protein